MISVLDEAASNNNIEINDLTKELYNILDDFMKRNFKNMKEKKNQNLVTPNIKNLKGLREKLVDKSMISGKKLSIETSDAKPKLTPPSSFKRLKLNQANK